jgi:hypothetical protein
MKRFASFSLAFCLSFLMTGVPNRAESQHGKPEAPPPARKIPGITAEDPFPRACVDCHVRLPEMDVRISTLMAGWNDRVEPVLLAKAHGSAPQGLALAGRHPAVPEALANIPVACLDCHAEGSDTAPPFAGMMHAIHLTGGEENHFLTLFQGECTHCHKLDPKTGAWSMPSGAEQ